MTDVPSISNEYLNATENKLVKLKTQKKLRRRTIGYGLDTSTLYFAQYILYEVISRSKREEDLWYFPVTKSQLTKKYTFVSLGFYTFLYTNLCA